VRHSEDPAKPADRSGPDDSQSTARDLSSNWTESAPQSKDEYSLQAFIELSKEIHTATDVYKVAEVGLLNFMGLLSTTSAAIWALTREGQSPVLLRRFGLAERATAALGELCVGKIIAHYNQAPVLVFLDDLENVLEPLEITLARQSKIALFAPLFSRRKPVGAVALGNPATGIRPSEPQKKVLEASLYYLGVALENTQLYSDILTQNQELRQAEQHLKELDQIKQEFLSNMHHELRTPLTIILSYLEMLSPDLPKEGPTREMLNAVQDQAKSLQKLVENLLTFNESRNETLILQISVQNPTSLLRKYWEERRPGISKDLRELTLNLEPNLPQILCDPNRLIQILDELVGNANKFTPPGSKISLNAQSQKRSDRQGVCLEVKDNGPGIPKEKLTVIFDSFRQADSSVTRTVGGLGLGLPLVQQLAKKMEIQFEFQSEEGKGSTCSLWLPAALLPEESPQPADVSVSEPTLST
jgi:signal transduction histidine kinase